MIHRFGDKKENGSEERLFFPQVIGVASGKGGVGKSTLAVHIALALKNQGLSVGILDGDIYGPSLPYLLKTNQYHKVSLGKITPLYVAGLKVVSKGFLANGDGAALWRGPIVHRFLSSLCEKVLWGDVDVIIVDLPPGTGDIPITICQKMPLLGVLLVSTPHELAVMDVKKTIMLFETLEVPILGLIENMSYGVCNGCGVSSAFFGDGLVEKLARERGYDFLAQVPMVPLLTREIQDAPGQSDPTFQEIHRIFTSVALQIRDKMS